ncbi:MAG: putative inorganic carbon transporter subunit DabA [Kineosporiaceae bacterium]
MTSSRPASASPDSAPALRSSAVGVASAASSVPSSSSLAVAQRVRSALVLPASLGVAGAGLVAAAGAAVHLAVAGDLRATLGLTVGGVEVPIGVHVDVVSLVLLLLVAVVGVCVAVFARRQLEGQRAARRFDLALAAALVALGISVTSAATLVIPLAWALACTAVSALVAHSGQPAAVRAARAVAARLLPANAVVLVGLALAAAGTGTADRAALAAAAADPGNGGLLLAGVLLAVAGIAVQAALVPFSRWLPETSWAPTPVSALLHAGVVNGGLAAAVLAWPLFAACRPALVVLGVLGLASIAAGSLAARVRPDVKGRLACSTTTQLGYTALQLALGLPGGALAHLCGHGLYKATLFLGQGGGLPRLPLADGSGTPAGTSLLRNRALPTGAGLVLGGLALAAAVAAAVGYGWGDTPAEALGALVAAAAAAAAWSAVAAPAPGLAAGPLPRRAQLVAAALLVTVPAAAVLAAAGWHGLAGGGDVWSVTAQWIGLAVAALTLLLTWAAGRAMAQGRLRALTAVLVAGLHPLAGHRPAPAGRPVLTPLDAAPVTAEEADAAHTCGQAAAGMVGPVWPLGTAVAVNPLDGLTRYPYEQALRLAGPAWQARLADDEAVQRSRFDDGLITRAALRAAAADWVAGQPAAWAGSGALDAADAVVERLLAAGEQPQDEDALSSAGHWRRLTFGEQVDHLHGSEVAAVADELANTWCAALLVAGLPSAGHDRLYPAWQQWASAPAVHRGVRVRGLADAVRGLPAAPDAAVALLLRELDVPAPLRRAYLARLLARTPGWAAHVAWRQRSGAAGLPLPATDVMDLIAVRLSLEVLLGRAVVAQADASEAGSAALTWPDLAAAVLASVPQVDAAPEQDAVAVALSAPERALIWQDALERSHRDQLVGGVLGRPGATRRPAPPAPAGLITCIDVRSERLRRHLEAAGGWRTWGTAGFFGAAVRHVDAQGRTSDRCPALLSPARTSCEVAPQGAGDLGARLLLGAQSGTSSALALAELGGWGFGLVSAARSWRSLRGGNERGRRVRLAPAEGSLRHDLSFAEQVDLAEGALRTIALVEEFPQVLVIAGHGGTTANNPFAAAYDCGACGGVSGGANARLVADVLDDVAVRAELARRGLVLPEACVVLAAVHDTTRDEITLLTPVPQAAAEVVASVLPMLEHAAAATAHERGATLARQGHAAASAQLARRSRDWAEIRPEWGLAGAAAIVVGGRELTTGLDLGARAFLQSYAPDTDPDGAVLGAILGGPVVVAQWITAQYSFSTLDPQRFGAGDKALHNAVGFLGTGVVGVLTGPRGDLRIGLPWQALFRQEPVPGAPADGVHTPQRLLCLVEGAPGLVDRALGRAPGAGRLVDNAWIRLVALDPATGTACERRAGGGWVRLAGDSAPVGA